LSTKPAEVITYNVEHEHRHFIWLNLEEEGRIRDAVEPSEEEYVFGDSFGVLHLGLAHMYDHKEGHDEEESSADHEED
jgi:hypothetical protein